MIALDEERRVYGVDILRKNKSLHPCDTGSCVLFG